MSKRDWDSHYEGKKPNISGMLEAKEIKPLKVEMSNYVKVAGWEVKQDEDCELSCACTDM